MFYHYITYRLHVELMLNMGENINDRIYYLFALNGDSNDLGLFLVTSVNSAIFINT